MYKNIDWNCKLNSLAVMLSNYCVDSNKIFNNKAVFCHINEDAVNGVLIEEKKQDHSLLNPFIPLQTISPMAHRNKSLTLKDVPGGFSYGGAVMFKNVK